MGFYGVWVPAEDFFKACFPILNHIVVRATLTVLMNNYSLNI
jgi:hypothetical protein